MTISWRFTCEVDFVMLARTAMALSLTLMALSQAVGPRFRLEYDLWIVGKVGYDSV